MVWTQICVVVYMCNVMHKTFFQLKFKITLYLWTLKFNIYFVTNYKYKCGLCFTWKKISLKFSIT